MMIVRFPLFLAAFFTALFAGYKVGEKLDPWDEVFSDQSDAMIKPSVIIPDNNQFNLLIIGVDDMNHPESNLESIWLAAQVENSSKITLVPVFPAIDDQELNIILSESFRMDGNKPGKEFWDAMKKTNFWWKGYLVSDKTSSIKLIDVLGGIGIRGQQMSGEQATGNITSWKDDATNATNHQKIFIESICNQISTNQSSNLKAIIEIIDHDFRTNKQTKNFIAKWLSSIAIDEKLTCSFPTLIQTPIKSTIVSP